MRKENRFRGFSLIELLAVVAIIIVIATLAMGALNSFGSAYELDSSVQGIGGILNSARQVALSQNKYVQVRFYQETNASDPRYQNYYAIGTYLSDSPYYTNSAGYSTLISRGWIKQNGPTYVLPKSVAVVKSAVNSVLLDQLAKDTTTIRTNTDNSGKMKDIPWVAFYFSPQGSIDVPYDGTTTNSKPIAPGKSFFSLCEMRKFKNDTLPPNYAMVLFDPVNGRMQVTRP